MSTTDTPRLEAALRYAEKGWPVLPLAGKLPVVPEWPTNATTDETTIRRWFKEWPRANVGILTGQRSGLFVLDVDVSDGKCGDESLRTREATHGALPRTIEVVTGAGGRHYYFHAPHGRHKSPAGKLGPGLDIRSYLHAN